MAWGSSFRSCDNLIRRLEENDENLTEVVILPTKTFTDADVKRLAAVLNGGRNSHWKSLSASSHAIKPQSLHEFGRAIVSGGGSRQRHQRQQRHALVELAIGHAEMGDEGVCALCEGLSLIDEDSGKTVGIPLEKVDLSWKGMSVKGFCSVLKAFGRSDCLEFLDLSRNHAIGESFDEADVVFVDATGGTAGKESLSLFPQLRVLNISDCNLTEAFTKFLFPHLEVRKRKISLSNNALLGDAGILPLLISSNHNHIEWIEELHLSNCGVGDDSVHALISAATSTKDRKLRTMKALDLSKNHITGKGVKDLVSCFGNNFESLNLASNSLGFCGVQSIVDGLVKRKKEGGLPDLSLLDLSETECSVAGAVHVVENTPVSTVHLFNNKLGSEGFRALAPSLRGGHRCIEHLDLSGNGADESAVAEMLGSLLFDDVDDRYDVDDDSGRVGDTCTGSNDEQQRQQNRSKLHTLVVGGNGTGELVESMVDRLQRVYPTLDVPRDKFKDP